MKWLKLARRNSTQNLMSNTVKKMKCGHERKLIWDQNIKPVDLSQKYRCYWEARYLGRLNSVVEVCDLFQEYGQVWGRMLEYGWIARRTLPTDTVLDVGSGKSNFPATLSLMTHQVVAVDIEDYSDTHYKYMNKLGVNYQWIRADARSLPFSEATFDSVVCVSVLEHIQSPGDAMACKEMVRVCKPGGRLLISVPYSHFQLIEDFEHPSGLQRYYTFHELIKRFVGEDLLLRDFNFIICGMPEEKILPRFGHPEEASIVVLCLEKQRHL